jgi:hypothetical protein
MRECGADEAGNPVTVSLRRLRRTVQVLVRKEPAQNSPEVHESVYMLPDPATKETAKDTIAQGLTNALKHAQVIVKMRMVLGDDADQLIELSDDPELAKAIANGDYDTATGACSDFTNSPFTEHGSPCTASFLLCLTCRECNRHPAAPATPCLPAASTGRTPYRLGPGGLGPGLARAPPANPVADERPHHGSGADRSARTGHRYRPDPDRPAPAQKARYVNAMLHALTRGGQEWPIADDAPRL